MYIDDMRDFKGNIHTLFGTSMHEVLQTYLTVMYEDTIKMADALPLQQMLLKRMKENYKKILEDNGGEEICEQSEMEEFYTHGLLILEWFKKKRGMYFSKKGYELVGIEVPLNCKVSEDVQFIGFMDVVLYDKIRDRYKIIDIKTSTMGWNKWAKADKNKTNQLLLYKYFYSIQKNVPIENIDVEYFIVKRKLYEGLDFPQRRVQTFSPANGKPSINKVMTSLMSFVDESFKKGEFNQDKPYPTNQVKRTVNIVSLIRPNILVMEWNNRTKNKVRMKLSDFINTEHEEKIMNKYSEVNSNYHEIQCCIYGLRIMMILLT